MDILEKKLKLMKRLASMDDMARMKKDWIRKKQEFDKFDALPEAEKRRRDKQGNNPHDPKEVRARKKAKYQEELWKGIPPEHRKMLEDNYGWFSSSKVTHRIGGTWGKFIIF